MSFFWLVYWFSTLNNLGVVLTIFAIVALIVGAVLTLVSVVMLDNYDKNEGLENSRSVRKPAIKALTFGALLLIVAMFFPSEKTMYLMVAGAATQQIVENTQVNELASVGSDVVKQFLLNEKQRVIDNATSSKK